MSRPAPPTQGTGGKGVAKFKRQMPPEQRERLSEVAKERHQQSDGKGFGRGLQKPGTPPPRKHRRVPRAAELVAAAAREKKNAEDIIDVFKDGIQETQPAHIRLKAAEAWLKIESDDAKLRLQEEESASVQRDRGELLELLAGKLSGGPASILLRRQLEVSQEESDGDVIEGHLAEEFSEE